MPSELTDNVAGIRRCVTHRMHVRDHLSAGIAKGGPFLPGIRKKAQIFGTVNARAWALPEGNRLNQRVLSRSQSLEQSVGAFGLFGRAFHHTANKKELRIMAAVAFGIDGLHKVSPLSGVVFLRVEYALSGQSFGPFDFNLDERGSGAVIHS